MLKICLVSPLPPPYGGISHWTTMIAEYASDREDVDLLIVNTAPRWRSIHSLGFLLRAVGGGFQLLRDLIRLVKALASDRFDVVHLTTSGQLAAVRDLIVSYIAALFGVSLVYHIRFGRIPVIAHTNTFEWRLICKVMHRASMVIVIDQGTFSAVKQFAPRVSVALIPNCVNVADFPVQDSACKAVKIALFVGWVIPAKGINELVEAWAKINPPGWRLEIVGPVDADYQNALMKLFQPRGVEFVGQLSHAHAMGRMANCDLFVLPSYTEGFPNVVVEAMALGRPIVATDVGAIPEMLEGNAGLLVKSKDSNALAVALNRVILDSELRARMGESAFTKAMNLYVIDVVFDAYMKVWYQSS